MKAKQQSITIRIVDMDHPHAGEIGTITALEMALTLQTAREETEREGMFPE